LKRANFLYMTGFFEKITRIMVISSTSSPSYQQVRNDPALNSGYRAVEIFHGCE
jgi:hypothetical protein